MRKWRALVLCTDKMTLKVSMFDLCWESVLHGSAFPNPCTIFVVKCADRSPESDEDDDDLIDDEISPDDSCSDDEVRNRTGEQAVNFKQKIARLLRRFRSSDDAEVYDWSGYCSLQGRVYLWIRPDVKLSIQSILFVHNFNSICPKNFCCSDL